MKYPNVIDRLPWKAARSTQRNGNKAGLVLYAGFNFIWKLILTSSNQQTGSQAEEKDCKRRQAESE